MDALKNLGSSFVSLLGTRLALLCTELEEEREHLLRLFILGVISVIFFSLGLVTFSFFVVVLFWDSPYRLQAIGVMSFAYLLISGIAGWKVRDYLNARPRFLDSTLTELEKDCDTLRN
ncbi:MAG: phage holin family protein [Verrucomicrobiota bacterium]